MLCFVGRVFCLYSLVIQFSVRFFQSLSLSFSLSLSHSLPLSPSLCPSLIYLCTRVPQYRIVCQSDEWGAFSPFVFLVLLGFTIALPLSIAVYLFVHRGELYSTAVYQRVGFLYAPFNRSAPWWAIHDVVLKMLLTGMLIYVPKEERAGIAIILCMIAIANLNYFRPHKSLLLFWLSQLAFLITSTKYVFATVLSAIDQDGSPDTTARVLTVGTFLIALDVCFILVAIGTICAAALLLRRKIRAQEDERAISSGEAPSNGRTTSATDTNLARVLPVHVAPVVMMGSQQQQHYDPQQHQHQQQPLPDDPTMAATIASEHESVVNNITASFDLHEKALQRTQSRRQNKSRRRTEMRLAARMKVKQSKCLQKVPIFAGLSPAAIEALLSKMKYSKLTKGAVLCKQGDPADEFYVVVNGVLAVTVEQPAPPTDNTTDTAGTSSSPGRSVVELRVGTLQALDFAGENAVVGGDETAEESGSSSSARYRAATLTVESDAVELLRLSTEDWQWLVQSGVMGADITAGVESGLSQREKQNLATMVAGARERETSAAGGEPQALGVVVESQGGGEGEEEGGNVSE